MKYACNIFYNEYSSIVKTSGLFIFKDILTINVESANE